MRVKHTFTNSIPDRVGFPGVQPSHWNADHTIEGDYATRTAAAAATISSGVEYLRTAGYSTAGDGGGALYTRVSSEPSHAGKFQSADGAWFEIAEKTVTPLMFGAKGDNSTDDTTVLTNFFSSGFKRLHIPAGRYLTDHGVLLITTEGVRVTADDGAELVARNPGAEVTTNTQLIGIDASRVTIDGLGFDGLSASNLRLLSCIRVGESGGTRRKLCRVRNIIAKNAVFGVRALWCDDLVVRDCHFEKMATPANLEYGDGVYMAGCLRPKVYNITGRNVRRNVVTFTHFGFLNTQDFIIDGVIAEHTYWSANSAAVWIEMRDSKDPRGSVSNVLAKDCHEVIYCLDQNSEVFFNTIIGRGLSENCVTGIGLAGGQITNFLMDGFETALDMRSVAEFQIALSSVSGTFGDGNTVTGGTSSTSMTNRYSDLQLKLDDADTSTLFDLGETVTDQTSGATGMVRDIREGFVYLRSVTGTFGTNEIVGATSGHSATVAAVNRRLFCYGALNAYPQIAETLTDGTSSATGTIDSIYQVPMRIGQGRISRTRANSVQFNVGASNLTPATLEFHDITIEDGASYGLVLVATSSGRYRKVHLRNLKFRGKTDYALRIYDGATTPGPIDELILNGVDTTEWTGSGKVRISTGIVTKWRLGELNPGTVPDIETINSDADVTLGPLAAPTQRHTGTLTQARTITLPAAGSVLRARPWRISRSGTGAFNLNVGSGPTVALATDEWADIGDTGSAHVVTAKGAL